MEDSLLKKITNFSILPERPGFKDNNFLSDKLNPDSGVFYQILNKSTDILFILKKHNLEILYANTKALEVFNKIESKSKLLLTELFDETNSLLINNGLKDVSFEDGKEVIIEHSQANKNLKIHFHFSGISDEHNDELLCKGIIQAEDEANKEKILIDNKRLENILQYSENLYFEVSLHGEIQYVSNSIKLLTDYTREEVLGKNLFEFYVSATDRKNHHKELLEKGIVNNSRIDLFDKNGRIRNVVANSFIVIDSNGKPFKIVGSLRDETETNILISLLEESEAKHRTFMENAGALIIYLNKQGQIILINRKASEFFAIESAEIANVDFFGHSNTESIAGQLKIAFNEVMENKKGQVDELCFELNGQTFYLMTNLQPVLDVRRNIDGVVIIATNVTDEREAQREMKKLQIAIEQSTAAITISDKNGVIEYANSRYCELTGFSTENIIGKTDFLFSLANSKRAYFNEMFERLNSKNVWKGEFENRKKDGELYWEKVIISPVLDENDVLQNFIAVRDDISDSKKISKIEEETIRNTNVLNNTSLSFLKLNDDANVFQFIGDQLSQLIPDYYFLIGSYNPKTKTIRNEYNNVDKEVLQNFFSKSKFTSEKISVPLEDDQLEILRNGEWQYFESGLNQMTVGKIDPRMSSLLMSMFKVEKIERKGIFSGDHLLGTIALISRVGQEPVDRNLLNTFLNQVSIGIERFNLSSELIKEKNKSDEMNRIKSTFLANMSHELRTPLNGILGFSELLIDQIEEERFCDMIRVINKSGLRLLDTLNTILDFSTIEGKNITLNYIEEDIVEIVREVIKITAEEAGRKGLSIELITKLDSLKTYTANQLVSKILGHLIKNSIKFTNMGGVKINISKNVTISSKEIHISIIDSGIGINPSQLENIFQEFRQESEGLTRKFEGTGLGLTISKKFATLLKGNILVKSSPAAGSEFTLVIPFYDSPPPQIN